MNELNSINDFFSQVGCQFQCFDMSRLIQPMSKQTLIDFEQTSISWNTPFMQHAWLAILFWAPHSAQVSQSGLEQAHYVWFLKLPLDEQAKLNLVARDDFLRRLVAALTNYLDSSVNQTPEKKLEALENTMKDNPYGFQPKQEQMANFHAIAHKQLSLSPSQFYPDAQNYFSGAHGFENWTALGYQGIADMAARLDENFQGSSNEALISAAIPHLPAAPLQVLSNCLEHQSISDQLAQAIYERLQEELAQNNNPVIAAICCASIHATAQARDKKLQFKLLLKILESVARSDIEVLATISGRCWQQLNNPEILSRFLEALAVSEHGQGAFNAILSDLMFIPGMRNIILQAFRSPERSGQLAQAIGSFFTQFN